MSRVGSKVVQRSAVGKQLFTKAKRFQTNSVHTEETVAWLSEYMSYSKATSRQIIETAMRGPLKGLDQQSIKRMLKETYSTYRGQKAQQLGKDIFSTFRGHGAQQLHHNVMNTFRGGAGTLARMEGQMAARSTMKTTMMAIEAGCPMIEAGAPLRNIFKGPVPAHMRALVESAVQNAYKLGKYTKVDLADAQKVLARGANVAKQGVAKQVAPKGNALEKGKSLIERTTLMLEGHCFDIKAGTKLSKLFTGPVPQHLRTVVQESVNAAHKAGMYSKTDLVDAAKVLARGVMGGGAVVAGGFFVMVDSGDALPAENMLLSDADGAAISWESSRTEAENYLAEIAEPAELDGPLVAAGALMEEKPSVSAAHQMSTITGVPVPQIVAKTIGSRVARSLEVANDDPEIRSIVDRFAAMDPAAIDEHAAEIDDVLGAAGRLANLREASVGLETQDLAMMEEVE